MHIRKRCLSHFKYPVAGVSLLLPCFLFFCCTSKSEPEHKNSSAKFNQYYLQGEQLYLMNCSNCHQSTGTGLGLLYPPLNRSDFMDNNVNDVICLIKHGKEGELIVNGKSFNKKMPAMPSLTNLEVAEIATYIYNSWEHREGNLIDVKQVDSILLKCGYTSNH